MPTEADVQELLRQASAAGTIKEAQSLVGQAEEMRTELRAEAAQQSSVDLAKAVVSEHLRPVRVYERHTAATDWIGEMDTSGAMDNDHHILAEANLWYSNVPDMVKEYQGEFDEQAKGRARKLAGSYGEAADEVEQTFRQHVAALHDREVRSGTVKLAADQLPQVGEEPGSYPTETTESTSGMPVDPGLPGEVTTSERAPGIQALENNEGTGATDVTGTNDPGLGSADTQVDRANNDLGESSIADLNNRTTAARHEESSMQMIQCPTCGGHGRTAARQVGAGKRRPPDIAEIVSGRHLGVSGLDQIDQTEDPHDVAYKPTEYPETVAWPIIENGPQNVQNATQTAEQQISQRNQRSPLMQQAQLAAHEAYRRVLAAGYDASGWLNPAGAGSGGYGPGQQDFVPGGGNNLGVPDPVYGFGGDQPEGPRTPVGSDERNDYTNIPGMNYQPGQPTQYDMGGRGESVDAAPAPGFPNAPKNQQKASSLIESDRYLQQCLAAARQRRAQLEQHYYAGQGQY